MLETGWLEGAEYFSLSEALAVNEILILIHIQYCEILLTSPPY